MHGNNVKGCGMWTLEPAKEIDVRGFLLLLFHFAATTCKYICCALQIRPTKATRCVMGEVVATMAKKRRQRKQLQLKSCRAVVADDVAK